MATGVLTNVTVLQGSAWTGTAPGPGNPSVSGTITTSADLSDHIKAVNINLSRANVDFTNFASNLYVENKPGLIDSDLSIDFYQDWAASSIDAVFGAAFTAGTLLYIDVKPTSSARGATNPSLVLAVYVKSYPPLGGAPGDAAMSSVSFMQAGKWSRLTS